MTDRRPKIAALIADAFPQEEYFFPKVALNEAGYQVEVVSSRKEPVEIYTYFARTGLLDVSARGGVIACICRGSMLAARDGQAATVEKRANFS
jgi:putative intracellular protease/amidase